jgi:hypothetical protein
MWSGYAYVIAVDYDRYVIQIDCIVKLNESKYVCCECVKCVKMWNILSFVPFVM